MTDPADLGVQEAASALANRQVSARELTENCLGRINSAHGQDLNAFIHVADDLARQQGIASDERRASGKLLSDLDGVPIAVKDNIDVRGMPTTNGLATHWTPVADAPVIQQLRAAGMIILGKLNMHEGALGATTDNPHHDRCMHPMFPGFTPGGSSGGSAAAVAGGLCPVTLGTDTMGSVRLPAAYCGIVGFKPSRSYWSVEGVMPLAKCLDMIGPLARTVCDVAAVLGEQLQVRDLGDSRFGRLTSLEAVETETECTSAFEAALNQLMASGVCCGETDLPGYEPGRARRSGFLISEADAFVAHKQLLIDVPEAFSPEFSAKLDYGRKITPARYDVEMAAVRDVARAFVALFDQFDVIVTLTAPQRTFPFGTPAPVSQADLTAPANFAGCPAISLPLGVGVDERPIGLQLIAAPGADAELLTIAAQVETILKI